MGLQNSGPMSIGGSTVGRSINLELGRSATATSSLNDSDLRDLAGISSGAISIGSFYGKSSLPAGASDYITNIGTMGSTQTLTLNSSTNLNLGSSGAALTMIDINGNTASYTPVTSTIASLVNVQNWATGSQSWGGYWSGSSYRRYLFSPAIAVTQLRTDSSGSGLYGRILRASYNGNMYTSSPQNGTITGTKYNNDQDWNAVWGTASHGAQNAVGNFYQIDFSTSWLLDELWVVNDGDWSADAVSINGDRLTNPQYLPVLTFSSSNNQDLKFFKAGEQVQGVGTSGVTYPYPGHGTNDPAVLGQNTTKLTGGSLNGYNTYLGSGGSQSDLLVFNPAITSSSGNNIHLWINQQPNAGYVYLNGSSTAENYTYRGHSSWNYHDTGLTQISSIKISAPTSNSAYVMGIQFMSEGANDANRIFFSPVTVVSTDISNNTMQVDGGAWTGSNGTSTGTAADRETVVTGPSKSGTGNFSSSSSNTVTVSSSNSEWISDDNRLGTKHYIKLV